MNDNKAFIDKWESLSVRNKEGIEWSLFVPQGAKPRTQRQFNLYNYYRFINSVISGKNYMSAVELGCGRGTIGLFLNKYDKMKVTLVDIDAGAINLAKENLSFFGGKADYVVADAQATGLPANSVDVAVSIGLLEHIPDYRKVLLEEYRILKPGGVIINLNIPEKWSAQKFNNIYKGLLRLFFGSKKLQKDYYRNGDKPEQYLAAAAEAGFKNCSVMNVNPFTIWTPIPQWCEYPLALLYRCILWCRGFFMKEPLKTNYLFSQGHFLVGYK